MRAAALPSPTPYAIRVNIGAASMKRMRERSAYRRFLRHGFCVLPGCPAALNADDAQSVLVRHRQPVAERLQGAGMLSHSLVLTQNVWLHTGSGC